MSTPEHSGSRSLSSITQIRPIKLDDFSDVRALHVLSFRTLGCTIYSDKEIEAFTRQVNSNSYADRLHGVSCFGAWIEDHLVGTCSWCPTGTDGITARIADVFVSPLFSRAGLGRLLIFHAENQARDAGFSSFTLRVGYHAVSLFAELGYELTSQGIYNLADDVPLAVAFMRKDGDAVPLA